MLPNRKMQEFGDDSRAILRVSWKGNNRGHVINIENKNGKILFVDPQIAGELRQRDFLGIIKPTKVYLTRTDNLRISERAKKSIDQKKRYTG